MSCELSSWRRQRLTQIPLYINVSWGCSGCREPSPATGSWETWAVTSWNSETPRVVDACGWLCCSFHFLCSFRADPVLAVYSLSPQRSRYLDPTRGPTEPLPFPLTRV